MTQKSVPLSKLSLPKGNPRRSYDKSRINGLADSIQEDGMLQNLIVEPNGDGGFHIIGGKRRYLALKLLAKRGTIDDTYKVPVIMKKLQDGDALRIATVENVQREALDPIDEAEAFATMLQHGTSLEDVAAKTGVSVQTIRRRLALADLCAPAKKAVRSGDLPLSVAEALTLGSTDQQRFFIEALEGGARLDRDEVRNVLLSEKPSVALAIFPIEEYTGSFTSDLFGDDETTLFDDVDQFFALQEKAVNELVEKCEKRSAFADLHNGYAAPWWHYRPAEKGEKGGVCIHLSPTGRVEIRKRLVRHEVNEEVVEATAPAPPEPKERPPYGPSILRYVAHHKSMAVQAALLSSTRHLKQVVAVLLLQSHHYACRIRVDPHSCIGAFGGDESPPKAYVAMQEALYSVTGKLGFSNQANGSDVVPIWPIAHGTEALGLYERMNDLSDEALDQLILLIPLLAFGQDELETPDTEASLFCQIAADLSVSMRDWWTPDERFLHMLKRDQLQTVAAESGAIHHMGTVASCKKHELVSKLAAYFEKTADPDATLDETSQLGRTWLPDIMRIPAEVEHS